ncbi:hypothetical protein GCM10009108_26760 [Castellaniella ginsengisoli]|uniref:Uncharacterized protein n=1 Tax=Castellaniella ginsengisoli TaxID=546114 RepID=A0ABN1L1Y3_9BURK
MIVGTFDTVLNYRAYIAKAVTSYFVLKCKGQLKIVSQDSNDNCTPLVRYRNCFMRFRIFYVHPQQASAVLSIWHQCRRLWATPEIRLRRKTGSKHFPKPPSDSATPSVGLNDSLQRVPISVEIFDVVPSLKK